MKAADWMLRSVRSSHQLAVRVATADRGVPLKLNGLSVRVHAASRHRFCADYEPSVAAFLRARIRPGSEVWNVGANVGVYALQLAAWVGPQGRVLAFEPNHLAAEALADNVRLNGFTDRVDIVGSAVGEAIGEATLFVSGVDGMSRLGRPNPVLQSTTAVDVPVATLDTFAMFGRRLPAWVIMDIEGSEIAALKSARHLLGRTCFVVELHPSAWPWSGHSRRDLEEILHEFRLDAVPLSGQADPLGEHGHVFIDGASRG